ncbi:hypothetical protein [Paraburkholderia jirisanensis]
MQQMNRKLLEGCVNRITTQDHNDMRRLAMLTTVLLPDADAASAIACAAFALRGRTGAADASPPVAVSRRSSCAPSRASSRFRACGARHISTAGFRPFEKQLRSLCHMP